MVGRKRPILSRERGAVLVRQLLGMKTVWINNHSERGSTEAFPEFIDYETTDLGEWLESIVGVSAE